MQLDIPQSHQILDGRLRKQPLKAAGQNVAPPPDQTQQVNIVLAKDHDFYLLQFKFLQSTETALAP